VVVSVSAGAGSVVLSVVLSVVAEVVADVVVEVVGVPVRPSSTGGGDVVVRGGIVGFGFGFPVMVGFAVLVRSESVVGVLGEVVVSGVVGGEVVVDGAGGCVVVVAAPAVGDPVTGDGVSLGVVALASVVERSVVDSATAMAAEAQ
jgi:hypothetical protein